MMNDEPLGRRPKGKAMMDDEWTIVLTPVLLTPELLC
jgi:hypothetical protein